MKVSGSAARLCGAVALIGTSLTVAVDVHAQDATIVDLTGVWQMTGGSAAYYDGRVSNVADDYNALYIEVTRQEGSVFFATTFAAPKDEDYSGHHGDERISEASWEAVGSISLDGSTVVIADVGDTTVNQCTIIDENTMTCQVWEAGDRALAGVALLERMK